GGRYTTVRLRAAEWLAAKLPSPSYVAVITCVPRPSGEKTGCLRLPVCPAVTVSTALPEASSSAKPITLPSTLNTTTPVGTPAPGEVGATVAASTTCWPDATGLGEAIRVVVVAATLTDAWMA